MDSACEVNKRTIESLSNQHFELIAYKNIITNVELSFADKFDNNLLHYAAKANNLPLITYLIEEKSLNINSRNRRDQTALHLAAQFQGDSKETVRYLLAHGADMEAADFKGHTPIFYAIFASNFSVINCLLNNNVSIQNVDSIRKANIFHYASLTGNLGLVKHLVEVQQFGAWMHDRAGETALLYAARRNELEIFKYLIEVCDLDIDEHSNIMENPLAVAVKHNSMDIVKYLVEEKSADIGEGFRQGMCSLHLACKFNLLDMVKYLLRREKSTIHAKDKRGNTPLHYAAEFAGIEILKILLENGANPKEVNFDGLSVLHFAVIGDNLDNVKYLIEVLNLNALAVDGCGENALFDAARSKSVDILKYFLDDRKLNAFVKSEAKRTLLHVAWNIDVVKYLVEVYDMDIYAIDANYKTPFDLAEKDIREYMRTLAQY